jgi:hypothetical protein
MVKILNSYIKFCPIPCRWLDRWLNVVILEMGSKKTASINVCTSYQKAKTLFMFNCNIKYIPANFINVEQFWEVNPMLKNKLIESKILPPW